MLGSLLGTTTAPLFSPLLVGEKRTAKVQVPEGAITCPLHRSFSSEKLPLAVRLPSVRLPAPELVRVKLAGPLVVPMSWSPKL